MANVLYAACLLWMTSQSITGVLVAQTTKSAVTVRPASVAIRAGGPTVVLPGVLLLAAAPFLGPVPRAAP
jgi:hypothetical protein